MFHKFKTTTYGTLLLIGVFVLPYAGNVADVNAENYNCSGSKKKVRQCLKAVISERDKQIVQMLQQLNALHKHLDDASNGGDAKIGFREAHEISKEWCDIQVDKQNDKCTELSGTFSSCANRNKFKGWCTRGYIEALGYSRQ
jgi:hypothetical protein